MRTEKEILERRAQVDYIQRSLLKRASDEKRALTAEESAEWDRADVDFQALTKELNMVQAVLEREGVSNEPIAPIQMQPQDPAQAKKAQAEKYFRALINGEGMSLDQAIALANNPMRASTSSKDDGLYVMPEEFISRLEMKMKAFGGMLQASYLHRSNSGNPMRWPTHDGTSETGNWVAQPRGNDIVPRGLTFDRNSFTAHTWYDIIGLDWEFVQDEEVGLVGGILADLIGEAAGRALNKAFTDGNGSGIPTGILDATGGAGLGKQTATNNAILKTELIDLIHSVDPAYRIGPNVAFMLHDQVLAYVRKLDYGTTDDQPVWQPSMQAGVPDRILGYNYVINQDFPNAVAASKKLVAFGDWSKYVIRQVRDVNIVRLNETFAARMQTAFLGWLRVDGKLIQPAAIKLLQTA
jgi:HK97 family phage major capsid protein